MIKVKEEAQHRRNPGFTGPELRPLDGRKSLEIDPNSLISDIDDIDLFTKWLQVFSKLNCCGLEDNVFVLVCMFLATAGFSAAQFLGAIAANSLAMYGDCATMALDALTYLLNIYCEKRRISGSKEAIRLELIVASISVASLTFVTTFLLWDSLQRLRTGHEEEDTVNADIMLRFSSFNFLIDLFSCGVFLSKLKETNVTTSVRRSSKQKYDTIGGGGGSEGSFMISDQANRLRIDLSSDFGVEIVDKKVETDHLEGRNLNMASAFLHLAADTLRTLTVMITATIVDLNHKNIDSVDADAIGSIIVCVIILAVVVALCFELVGLTLSLRAWNLAEEAQGRGKGARRNEHDLYEIGEMSSSDEEESE